MKKAVLVIFCFFMCFGCQKKIKENSQMIHYHNALSMLKKSQTFEENNDFHVNVIFNALDNGYRYDVIIDQTQIDMYDIEAIAYANETDNQMCPTIGIFDEEEYHLCNQYVDKENGFYKGIQLSGTCEKKQNVYLYICYYVDAKKTKKVEKIIEVKDNEIR